MEGHTTPFQDTNTGAIPYHGGLAGKLVDGRYDERTDYPLGQYESGEKYLVVHIEQSAGFPGSLDPGASGGCDPHRWRLRHLRQARQKTVRPTAIKGRPYLLI